MKCYLCRVNEGLFDIIRRNRKRRACGPCAETIEDADGGSLDEQRREPEEIQLNEEGGR